MNREFIKENKIISYLHDNRECLNISRIHVQFLFYEKIFKHNLNTA